MFNSNKKTEDKVNYEITVLAARQTKFDNTVMIDLDVNGVKIYSCVLKEMTVKKDGEKYKAGDTFYVVNLPQEKGSDGKYYDRVWFPRSNEAIKNIVAQVEKKLS